MLAQHSRSRAHYLANRAAVYLTFVVIDVALLTLIGWSIACGFDNYTLERVVTVLEVIGAAKVKAALVLVKLPIPADHLTGRIMEVFAVVTYRSVRT